MLQPWMPASRFLLDFYSVWRNILQEDPTGGFFCTAFQ